MSETAAYKLPKPVFATDASLDKELRSLAKQANKPRYADPYFHPHTFGKWCRRREVFRLLAIKAGLTLQSPSPAPAALRLFEAGHACHDRFRDYSLGHMLYGYWECRRCGSPHGFTRDEHGKIQHERLMFRPAKCKNCGYAPKLHDSNEDYPFHYAEFQIRNDDSMIMGHCDGIIHWRDRLRVLEIKSEDPQMYVERAGPTLGNGMQGTAYAYVINHNYREDLARDLPESQQEINTVLLTYVNKSTYRCDKSYLIKAGPLWQWIRREIETVRVVLDEILARTSINTIDDLIALEHDPHFNRHCPRACAHRDVAQAKQCHSRRTCFASTFKR